MASSVFGDARGYAGHSRRHLLIFPPRISECLNFNFFVGKLGLTTSVHNIRPRAAEGMRDEPACENAWKAGGRYLEGVVLMMAWCFLLAGVPNCQLHPQMDVSSTMAGICLVLHCISGT